MGGGSEVCWDENAAAWPTLPVVQVRLPCSLDCIDIALTIGFAVCVSAASKLGDLAPRSGFFFVLDAGEIVVTRWDPTTEQLTLPTHMDKDEVERVRAGMLLRSCRVSLPFVTCECFRREAE
jgi:hypothetical protein